MLENARNLPWPATGYTVAPISGARAPASLKQFQQSIVADESVSYIRGASPGLIEARPMVSIGAIKTMALYPGREPRPH